MKRLFRIEVGLFILSIALLFSFFGGSLVTLNLGYRIVDILQWNPNRYFDYIRNTLLYLILPPAIGLTFSIIAYAKEMKSPAGVLDAWWLIFTAFGIFFFFWGVLGILWTYGDYKFNIRYGSKEIASPLSTIYSAVLTSYIVWMFSGILFLLSPIFKIILKTKGRIQEARR